MKEDYVIVQVVVENLLKITYWQVAPYEHVFTPHQDRPEPRATVQRRMTQWSQRKGGDKQYILPKEQKIAVGMKLQVWEQVREQVRKLAHASDPQLLSLNRSG